MKKRVVKKKVDRFAKLASFPPLAPPKSTWFERWLMRWRLRTYHADGANKIIYENFPNYFRRTAINVEAHGHILGLGIHIYPFIWGFGASLNYGLFLRFGPFLIMVED